MERDEDGGGVAIVEGCEATEGQQTSDRALHDSKVPTEPLGGLDAAPGNPQDDAAARACRIGERSGRRRARCVQPLTRRSRDEADEDQR